MVLDAELTEQVLELFNERKTLSFAQLLVLFGTKIGTILARLEGMDLIVPDDKPGIWKLKK